MGRESHKVRWVHGRDQAIIAARNRTHQGILNFQIPPQRFYLFVKKLDLIDPSFELDL
jgi:hypothetical protein